MLIRPFERPLRLVHKGEPEPLKLIDVEVEDIHLGYPGDPISLTIRADRGESWTWGSKEGQLIVRSNEGVAIYDTTKANYIAIRKRIIKEPEPKFVPSASLSNEPPVNTGVVEHSEVIPDNLT